MLVARKTKVLLGRCHIPGPHRRVARGIQRFAVRRGCQAVDAGDVTAMTNVLFARGKVHEAHGIVVAANQRELLPVRREGKILDAAGYRWACADFFCRLPIIQGMFFAIAYLATARVFW